MKTGGRLYSDQYASTAFMLTSQQPPELRQVDGESVDSVVDV